MEQTPSKDGKRIVSEQSGYNIVICEHEGSLERSVETRKGQVLCHCDGTSRAVRACLQSTRISSTDSVFDAGGGQLNLTANSHVEIMEDCARDGFKRINEIFDESSGEK